MYNNRSERQNGRTAAIFKERHLETDWLEERRQKYHWYGGVGIVNEGVFDSVVKQT